MGFFDKFSSSVKLTPAIALATAMVYMSSSDSDLADEELNYLASTLTVLGNPQEILSDAVKYAKKTDINSYLEESNTLLSDEQKMVIVANLADLLLSDGSAEPEEEKLFFQFVDGWKINREDIETLIHVINTKNNYSILN